MFKKTNLNSPFNSGNSRSAGFVKNDSPTHQATGLKGKTASAQIVSRVGPKPYSPFYEESNLFMPRDRRETFAWARHFYASDPWVGNALDLHSTYPLSSFGVKCESLEITKFYNDMLDELNFDSVIYEIAREYYIMGEVFPYCELDEETGKWSQIIVHNPDYIEVRGNILTSPAISLIPDEEIKRLVTSTNPDDIIQRQQIPEDVLTYVFAGKNIPLHPAFISHIARKPHPYLVRGTTILSRVFKDLMYRDKLREAQFVIADRHITPLKIFKVGMADGSYRPIAEDLANFRDLLEQAMYDPDFTIVTHPGLEVQYVGATGTVLPLDSEMDKIEDRILTGLFTSKAFTHSEGPTYSNASVALEVLQQRYVSFRTLISKWLEWKVFRPIAKINDFHRYNNGVKELIIPEVNWEKINLKNNREYQDSLANLVRDNKVSIKSLYNALDLSYEEEIHNIKSEIEDFKEIMYKLQTPYVGKENINVATGDVPAQPQQGGEAGSGGDMGGLGGGGGGGDMGGGMGDLGGDLGGGDLGGMGGDLGGGPDLGGGDLGGGPAGGGGGEAPLV